MKKQTKMVILIFFTLIFLILGIIFISIGFDKMFNYHNSEYTRLSKNAYVGGDAYNYIINSGYFAGFVSLGGSMILASSIFGTSYIKLLDEKEEKKKSKHERNQNEKEKSVI